MITVWTHREGPADCWVEWYWDEEARKGAWEGFDLREGGWYNQEGLCLHPRQAGCPPHPAGALCEFCQAAQYEKIGEVRSQPAEKGQGTSAFPPALSG